MSTSNEPKPTSDKVRVGIPVALTAVVYIDADIDMPAGATRTDVDGVSLVCMDEDSPDDWAAVASSLERSAEKYPEVAEVRSTLRAAAAMILRFNPHVDVRFSPLAGIVPEQRVTPGESEPS